MSEGLAEGKSTSYKAELEINWEYYGNFVNDDIHKLRIEVVNDNCLVKKPGIYKLVSNDLSELYVGEGQFVHKRLSNYKNARYELQEKNEMINQIRIEIAALRIEGPLDRMRKELQEKNDMITQMTI